MASRTRGGSAPLDEREFHRWLIRRFPGSGHVRLGIGDDAAALAVPTGRVAILTTDSLVEGTHFLPESPPERIGRAAAAVSLSDAAAKGADPAGLLIALVVPPGTRREWAARVLEGADREGRASGAPLIGGDTKPGPIPTIVSTIIAWARPEALAPRTGARPGDLLVTTGVAGRGGWAYHRLLAARRGADRRRALSAQLDIRPRVREGQALAPLAHAMLDTSDGLAESSILLAEASRVRVVVEEGALPLPRALAIAPLSPRARRLLVLYGGDYELLAAIPRTSLAPARGAMARLRCRLTVIGRVERGRGAHLWNGDSSEPMPRAGWRHFASPRSP